MHRFLSGYFIIVLLISAISCKGDINDISSGNDPNFTIISHSDQGFSSTNRKVNVQSRLGKKILLEYVRNL